MPDTPKLNNSVLQKMYETAKSLLWKHDSHYVETTLDALRRDILSSQSVSVSMLILKVDMGPKC